jgi:hypothetical protein
MLIKCGASEYKIEEGIIITEINQIWHVFYGISAATSSHFFYLPLAWNLFFECHSPH